MGKIPIQILIADDADHSIHLTCQCLGKYLEELGHNPKFHVASNGVEALQIFEKIGKKIDFIIMDMMMPYMSGYEALKLMKGLDSSLPEKTVILSAYAVTDEIKSAIKEELIKEGNKLPKPCDFPKLATYIVETINASN